MKTESQPTPDHTPDHFKGKEAIQHVAEVQSTGIIAAAESHGAEIPGHISAAADAARETALILFLLCTTLHHFAVPITQILYVVFIFGLTWVFWRIGRSAWLAWSRLERLHRIIEEERWEIEHHRGQEREELQVLYAAKGLQGKLLEDVVDVLMADSDRLLRVMAEEELGLQLEVHEHPLKQGIGAGIGALIALTVCSLTALIIPPLGITVGGLAVIGTAAAVAATYEKNRLVPAIVWNIGLGVLAFGIISFLLDVIR